MRKAETKNRNGNLKNGIFDLTIKLITFLKTYVAGIENKNGKYDTYESLSPTENGDQDGHYGEALYWALKNRKKKDIKNIAVTGPYGSGKSSVLKTFQKKFKTKFKFLNISLATFQEEKNKISTSPTTELGKDLLRLIEISILEQIFYHENDKNIPDLKK